MTAEAMCASVTHWYMMFVQTAQKLQAAEARIKELEGGKATDKPAGSVRESDGNGDAQAIRAS